MKIHEEQKEIVGLLIAQGERLDMLELSPSRNRVLPAHVQEHAFEFYVVFNGYARYVIVSKGSFLVIPFLDEVSTQTVKFLVEEENIKVDSLE